MGKFGWKGQVPSLAQFSADAYLNEMGITTSLFPFENCPQGNCNLLVCATPVLPQDGDADAAKFTDFMTFLGPFPRGPVTGAARQGEAIFSGRAVSRATRPRSSPGTIRDAPSTSSSRSPISCCTTWGVSGTEWSKDRRRAAR